MKNIAGDIDPDADLGFSCFIFIFDEIICARLFS